MCFKMGRTDPWNEHTCEGNPALSSVVNNHVKMAKRRQHDAGELMQR